jgi:hypothetical protein
MPTKDAEFISWAKNINAKSTANQALWNLNDMQVSKLNGLTENAESTWKTNGNPETANRRTSAEKKQAFSELKHFLSRFTDSFYGNDAITDADMEAMGLRPRKMHSTRPKPEPDEAPEVRAMIGQHHEVTVYVSKTQHGEPVRSLNTKYYGFIVRYRKDGEEGWQQQMSTRLHTTLHFDPEDRGKQLRFAVAWLNGRLQHGPWSNEIATQIN